LFFTQKLDTTGAYHHPSSSSSSSAAAAQGEQQHKGLSSDVMMLGADRRPMSAMVLTGAESMHVEKSLGKNFYNRKNTRGPGKAGGQLSCSMPGPGMMMRVVLFCRMFFMG